MEVIWNHTARDHLGEIRAFVAATSPDSADELIDRLIARSAQLADFPLSGPLLRGAEILAIRTLREGSYRIVYVVIRERVEILGVVHGRRRLFGSRP